MRRLSSARNRPQGQKEVTMARFKFTVTRNITESAIVEVIASTIEDAHKEGLRKANACEVEGWQTDDFVNGDAYIPDTDDYEIIKPKPAPKGRKRAGNGKDKVGH